MKEDTVLDMRLSRAEWLWGEKIGIAEQGLTKKMRKDYVSYIILTPFRAVSRVSS
jgi:hypothetical protein